MTLFHVAVHSVREEWAFGKSIISYSPASRRSRGSKSFQEADRHVAQFPEALPEVLHLDLLAARGLMGGVELFLAADLPGQQPMLGDRLQLVVIDQQFDLGHPHRQQFADVLPGHRIVVLPKVDPALRVGHPIHDQGRIVGVGGQGQQMRPFFGVGVDRPFL